MSKIQRVVVPLRVLLVLTFGAFLVLQFFALPNEFAAEARESPDQAWLRWPMTVFAALEVLCVQVVIVCTWRLLTMVERDHIFRERSLVWVDGIVRAIVTAWAMLAAVSAYLGAIATDPALPILLILLLLVGGVLGLLMVVMRALLRQAIVLRTDLDAVI